MLRSTLRAAVCLFIVLAPMAARGEDADPPIDCANAMSTHEMNFCAGKELDAADAKLNAAYKIALEKIALSDGEPPYDPKSWEEALRKSQRAWVAFRDADCKDLVPMAWTGGTGATVHVLWCIKALTEERTKELTERFEGE